MAVDETEFKRLIEEMTSLKEAVRNQKVTNAFTEIFNSEQAAEYLKITERHLARLKSERKITFAQLGKVVRYRREDLDNWLNQNRVTARTGY